MKTTKGQRLKQWLDLKGIPQVDLAKNLGLKKASINDWVSRGVDIPDKHVIKIIELFPDLPARWFITGEGTINEEEKTYTSKSDHDEIKEDAKFNITRIDCQECLSKQKLIDAQKAALDAKDELLELYRGKKGGSAAAGA